MFRIKYLISGLLVATISSLFNGCGPLTYQTEFPGKIGIIEELIHEETPVLDGNLIYNPDIIEQLYAKSEDLLSKIWERRENQMNLPGEIISGCITMAGVLQSLNFFECSYKFHIKP